jgi:hypothetical protein
MESGNLNFLEPSGSLQACNGTALPFFKKNGLQINGMITVLFVQYRFSPVKGVGYKQK